MKCVIGIDEAGRGPVLGPMVIAAVSLPDEKREEFCARGVQDSKAIGTGLRAEAKRRELATWICQEAQVVWQVIPAVEIDQWVWRVDGRTGLNAMEQHYAGKLIAQLPRANRIVADGARLFAPLKEEYPQLEALNKADALEVSVAAASIVAKSKRDEAVAAILKPLEERFGKVKGGGYPNGGTASFLREYVSIEGALPGDLRQSWNWAVLAELKNEISNGDKAAHSLNSMAS